MNKRALQCSCVWLILFTALWLTACGGGQDSGDISGAAPTAAPAQTLPPPAVAANASATPRPTVAPLSSPTPRPTATRQPTLAPTDVPPTAEPTMTATTAPPTATAVPPTPTPVPPTSTPEPLYAEWLGYLNRFREMGGVGPLNEQTALTLGSRLHSQYMVVNDAAVSHKQDPALPLFDPAGDKAAKNSNVFATSMVEADYAWGINFWVSAPFHLVPMIAPRLERVGYGDYNEAGGDVSMAAVLDVRSERNTGVGAVSYPLFFPKDGSTTWIGRHNLFEWPDPLSACPGYSRPTGAPIVVQFGDGSLTPSIGNPALLMGDTRVDICVFDENTYYSPNTWEQKAGRQILNSQDAVVIMPRHPLVADQIYTVQLDANGQRYQWSFRTAAQRPVN